MKTVQTEHANLKRDFAMGSMVLCQGDFLPGNFKIAINIISLLSGGKMKCNETVVRAAIAGLSLMGITGCASVTGSKMEPVSVQTYYKGTEVSGINCKLLNDKGTWFVTTPGSVVTQKSYENLDINCSKDGYEPGSAIVKSASNGAVWGNIIAGGGIGYVIDRSSGAGFDYPSLISVELGVQNKLFEPKKQTGPDKENKPAANESLTPDISVAQTAPPAK